MNSMIYRLMANLLLLIAQFSLQAETTAIIPFRVNHYSYTGTIALEGSTPEEKGIQMARAAWLMQRLMNIPNLVAQNHVESHMKSGNLSLEKKITISQLKNIARELDADKLLLFSVKPEDGISVLESKIFYAHSGQITDSIITHEENPWKNIQKNLYERYPSKRIQIAKAKGTDLLIFAEASGGTFREINLLRKKLSETDFDKYGMCLFHPDGKVSESKMIPNRKLFIKNLEKVALRGGEKKLKYTSRSTNCIRKRNIESKESGNLLKTIILLSGEPEGSEESIRVKGQLRELVGYSADTVVVLSANADPQAHFTWQNTVNELKQSGNISISHTLIRIAVGLSDGSKWNIFKRGLRIAETQNSLPEPGSGIEIPPGQQATANAENLISLYTKMSGNKVVSSSAPSWLFMKNVLQLVNARQESSARNNTRLGLVQNGVKFFLDFPASQLRQSPLKRGETADFTVSVRKGQKGFPLENLKGFGFILPAHSQAPTPLLLDIRKFMKNPNLFSGESFGDGNIYIIRAQVLSITMPEEDALE